MGIDSQDAKDDAVIDRIQQQQIKVKGMNRSLKEKKTTPLLKDHDRSLSHHDVKRSSVLLKEMGQPQDMRQSARNSAMEANRAQIAIIKERISELKAKKMMRKQEKVATTTTTTTTTNQQLQQGRRSSSSSQPSNAVTRQSQQSIDMQAKAKEMQRRVKMMKDLSDLAAHRMKCTNDMDRSSTSSSSSIATMETELESFDRLMRTTEQMIAKATIHIGSVEQASQPAEALNPAARTVPEREETSKAVITKPVPRQVPTVKQPAQPRRQLSMASESSESDADSSSSSSSSGSSSSGSSSTESSSSSSSSSSSASQSTSFHHTFHSQTSGLTDDSYENRYPRTKKDNENTDKTTSVEITESASSADERELYDLMVDILDENQSDGVFADSHSTFRTLDSFY